MKHASQDDGLAELEPVDAERVFEGGDLHAGVRVRGGRDCGIHGVAPNRCRIGTNQVRAGLDPARMQGTDPTLIVTLETTSKVHRNMSPADPASTRLRECVEEIEPRHGFCRLLVGHKAAACGQAGDSAIFCLKTQAV